MSSAKPSFCAKCGDKIGAHALLIGDRIYHHECSPYREAAEIARDIRDQTVDVCVKTVKSLLLDSQGLTLDAGTIYACCKILHNLKAASRPSLPSRNSNG